MPARPRLATLGYAAAGDTNLDCANDIFGVANFIGSGECNMGLSVTWAEGNFNYDGIADILHMAEFLSSALFNAAPCSTSARSIVAVPEPSTLGLVGVGIHVAGVLAKKRQRAAGRRLPPKR